MWLSGCGISSSRSIRSFYLLLNLWFFLLTLLLFFLFCFLLFFLRVSNDNFLESSFLSFCQLLLFWSLLLWSFLFFLTLLKLGSDLIIKLFDFLIVWISLMSLLCVIVNCSYALETVLKFSILLVHSIGHSESCFPVWRLVIKNTLALVNCCVIVFGCKLTKGYV